MLHNHVMTSLIEKEGEPFDAYCCHMGTAIKHPVPARPG